MCVGTYLGSLVLSETLSYSYQNIFFTRQNWLFTLAIKLILKKQEKKYASELTLFQFHFHWMFFFQNYLCFLLQMKFAILFKVSKSKKKSHKYCQNLGFSSKNFFWPEWIFLLVKTMCACIQSEITASGWARLCHIWPNWTLLDHIGPHWA